MKYIVLDDEPIIRQGLIHKIGQTGLPLLCAGEADNGVAGLSLLQQVQPDLVITDIQMPDMNGLEFIGRAQELLPRLDYIILSGYDDFDYAKQAMRYGVSHYLLKPVEDEELYEALSRLLERLQAEDHRDRQVMALQHLAESSQEAARSQALLRFLSEDEGLVDDPALSDIASRCSSLSIAVFQVGPVRLPHLSFGEDEEELVWYAVKNMVTQGFKEANIAGLAIHHPINRSEFIYVLGLNAAQQRTMAVSAAETILYGIRRYLKLDAVGGIGPAVHRVDGLQEAYREARQLARNAVIHGGNRVGYATGALPYKANRESIILSEDAKLLEEWLQRLESDKILRWIKRRLGAIAQDPNSVFVQVEWFCVDLYLLFNKYLLAHAVDAEWTIGEMDDLLRWLQQVTSFVEIEERMRELASTVIGRLSRRSDPTGKAMMELVRAYIAMHYAEPLSLQAIGERFAIHPTYFSKRFKETYGETFIDYLTSVRMDTAARLLRDTELKVHQIGERIGIEDAAYFGSVFRKRYGETPRQYRERAQQG